MATNFSNTQFSVSDTLRLSMSSWVSGSRFVRAIALKQLVAGKWVLIHDTAVELSSANEKDAGFRAVDVGTKLVEQATGLPLPERFFRDNGISNTRAS